MRDSLRAETFSKRGEHSPQRLRVLSLKTGSKMSDRRNIASSRTTGQTGRDRGRLVRPLATWQQRHRAATEHASLSTDKISNKRARSCSSRSNSGNSKSDKNGVRHVSQGVQWTAADLCDSTSPPPPRKRGRPNVNERPTRDASASGSRSAVSRPSVSRVDAGIPKLAPHRNSVASSTRQLRRTTTSVSRPTPETASGASAPAATIPAPPSPFRPPTRQVRSRPIDLDRNLRRYVVDDSTANSRCFRNPSEYRHAVETLEALAQREDESGVYPSSAFTAGSVSGAAGQSRGGVGRSWGRTSAVGGREGMTVEASTTVGSRRPAGRCIPTAAPAGGSAASPARRGAAAASTPLPPLQVPPLQISTPEAAVANTGASTISVPNYREHGLFGRSDDGGVTSTGTCSGEAALIEVRGGAGARRRRPACAVPGGASSGGGSIPPPGAPRCGVSSVHVSESDVTRDGGRTIRLRGAEAGVAAGSRGKKGDKIGAGVGTESGEDRPRILARSWVVRGSDYDADDEDIEFLAELNKEMGVEGVDDDEESWVVTTALFEDMVEKLELQDSRARDRKILVESSERLVREFSEVTNRVVSVCDEADGILDAFTSDAESDAGMPAALEDKQDHNKNGEGRTVSAAREIVDEIQRKIKCFETTSNGSNEHASSRSKGCHSEDGNPLAPAAAAAASVFASVNPMEDPTLRGPVALSEGMALPLLRKRVKAFQPSFGTGGQDGSDSSNSAIYYGSIPGSSTSPGQEQFRSTATPVDCIVGRSAGGVGSTRVSRGGSRTAEAAVAAGRVGAGRGASGMRGQVLTEGDRGWKGKSRATDKAPKEISDEMLLSIFGYWAAKRQAYGGPMLRCLHSFIMELWERMADPDPEDLEEAMNLEADVDAHELLRRCRLELENLRMLADLVKRREKNKKSALTFTEEIFDLVKKAVDNLHILNGGGKRQSRFPSQRPVRRSERRNSPSPRRGRQATSSKASTNRGVVKGEERPVAVREGGGRRGATRRGESGGRAAAEVARHAVHAIALKEAGFSSDGSREYGDDLRREESKDDGDSDNSGEDSSNDRRNRLCGSIPDVYSRVGGARTGNLTGSSWTGDNDCPTSSFPDGIWEIFERLPVTRSGSGLAAPNDEEDRGQREKGVSTGAARRNAKAGNGRAAAGRGASMGNRNIAGSRLTYDNRGMFVHTGPSADTLDHTAAIANHSFGGATPTGGSVGSTIDADRDEARLGNSDPVAQAASSRLRRISSGERERLPAMLGQVTLSERDERFAARAARVGNPSRAPSVYYRAAGRQRSRRTTSTLEAIPTGTRRSGLNSKSSSSAGALTSSAGAAPTPTLRPIHPHRQATQPREDKPDQTVAAGRGTSAKGARNSGAVAAPQDMNMVDMKRATTGGRTEGASAIEALQSGYGGTAKARRGARGGTSAASNLKMTDDDEEDMVPCAEQPTILSNGNSRTARREARAQGRDRTDTPEFELKDTTHGNKRGRSLQESAGGAGDYNSKDANSQDADGVMIGAEDKETDSASADLTTDAGAAKRRRATRGALSVVPQTSSAVTWASSSSSGGRVSQAAAAVAATARAVSACIFAGGSARSGGGPSADRAPPSAGAGGASVRHFQAGSANSGASGGGGLAATGADSIRRTVGRGSPRKKRPKRTAAGGRPPRALQGLL